MKLPEPEKRGVADWMATYSDMVTLLMCFFILLFAFSNIDAQKFEAVMLSFQGSAGILSGGHTFSEATLVFDGLPENQTSNMQMINEDTLEALKEEIDRLEEILAKYITEEQLADENVEVIKNPTSLILRFKSNALFDPLSAELKPDAIELLTDLAEILMAESFNFDELLVEGHTDNMPEVSELYPSGWELSAARAASVTRFLVEECGLDPFKISSAGYGAYHPIATNTTEAGRALNRRVDIIIKAGDSNE